MLKIVFRSLLWLLAIIGAFTVTRTLCWPTSATLFETDDHVVVLLPGAGEFCVVMDDKGAPSPDYDLWTESDSGPVGQKTDSSGRGQFVSYDPYSASIWFPGGTRVPYVGLGLAVLIRTRR